jgi:hypothetical protein
MKTWLAALGVMVCCGAVLADDAVRDLSKHLGRTPALVVVVCPGDEQDLATIAGLVEKKPWRVLCRGPASPGMAKVRDWAREKGILGGRVCVVDEPAASLWLAADMADAVWLAPGAGQAPSEEEVLRVLRPGGVCVASGKVVVKPAPSGVDEWRHPYHGPDNNVVSQDRVARLPGELRFQTQPVFAPMPNQTLFAGGRIRDVMRIPLDDAAVWAGKTADVCGVVVGSDGLVVLHRDSVEGISPEGRSLWTAPLPAPAGAVGNRPRRQPMRSDALRWTCGRPALSSRICRLFRTGGGSRAGVTARAGGNCSGKPPNRLQ